MFDLPEKTHSVQAATRCPTGVFLRSVRFYAKRCRKYEETPYFFQLMSDAAKPITPQAPPAGGSEWGGGKFHDRASADDRQTN